jgi:hypothetical protein
MKNERAMLYVWLGSIAFGGFGVIQLLHPIPTGLLLAWAERALVILIAYLFGKLAISGLAVYLAHRGSRPVTAERVTVKTSKPAREAFSVNTQRANAGRRVV